MVSAVRGPGGPQERRIVGLLRAALDVAIFALTYVGLLAFLRDAKPVLGLLLSLIALGCALALAPLRVRDTEELEGDREELGPQRRRPVAR